MLSCVSLSPRERGPSQLLEGEKMLGMDRPSNDEEGGLQRKDICLAFS